MSMGRRTARAGDVEGSRGLVSPIEVEADVDTIQG
jgi:hypothetical protein